MSNIAAMRRKLEEKQADKAAKVSARDALNHAIVTLNTQIETWIEAIRLAEDEGAAEPEIEVRADQPEKSGKKRRVPKGPWRTIMPEMLLQYPSSEFGLADVEVAGELVGTPIKRTTTRSQMSNYVTERLLVRIREGQFKFTEEGRAYFAELSVKPARTLAGNGTPASYDVCGDLGELGEGSASPRGIASSGSVGGAPR